MGTFYYCLQFILTGMKLSKAKIVGITIATVEAGISSLVA